MGQFHSNQSTNIRPIYLFSVSEMIYKSNVQYTQIESNKMTKTNIYIVLVSNERKKITKKYQLHIDDEWVWFICWLMNDIKREKEKKRPIQMKISHFLLKKWTRYFLTLSSENEKNVTWIWLTLAYFIQPKRKPIHYHNFFRRKPFNGLMHNHQKQQRSQNQIKQKSIGNV